MNNDWLQKKKSWHSFGHKVAIGTLWVGLLMFFLSLPKFTAFFDKSDTINVYMFAEMISTEAIARFQEETGINVKVSYFELDEELYAKFRINQGAGYDVAIVTDHLIKTLAKEGYLHEIDRSKITHFNDIDKRLLGHYFDPHNRWSVPVVWLNYGLVYNKEFFKSTPSWASIYTSPYDLMDQGEVDRPFKVCMVNEPRDLIELARIYLFGKQDEYLQFQIDAIRDFLIKQKKWVESYTTSSLEYFLVSGVVPIAMTSSNYAKRIIDFDDAFDFVIPKEGSVTFLENFVIPEKSTKKEFAHKFIDYMLSPESGKMHNDEFLYNPANAKSYQLLDQKDLENKHIFPDEEMFKRLYITENKTPKSVIEEVWVALGVA